MTGRALLFAFALYLLLPAYGSAEDLGAIFKKVSDLAAAGSYPKALEELGWAKKEIEKMHLKKLETFFPDTLEGYKAEKLESQSALGFSTIERVYKKGKETVKLSLTGGAGDGSPLGGLAGLGKMAAMMGGPGQDTFRVAGRTATLETNEAAKSAEMTIFLDSGSILKIESNKSADAEALKKLAEQLKVGDLDNYLRGA